MTVTQAWLVFGGPALLLGSTLFIGRSVPRTVAGYVVLLAGFAVMAAFDRVGGAVFGGLLALLYAAGRGGASERAGDPRADIRGLVGTDRTLDPPTSGT